MIARHGLDAQAAKPVVKCASYLVKNARWLHYDRALAEACRSRPASSRVRAGILSRTGWDAPARCGPSPGPEAVLRLRALRTSGDFDDYWQFHLAKEYERTHASRYAERAVPTRCLPCVRT